MPSLAVPVGLASIKHWRSHSWPRSPSSTIKTVPPDSGTPRGLDLPREIRRNLVSAFVLAHRLGMEESLSQLASRIAAQCELDEGIPCCIPPILSRVLFLRL